MIVIWFASFVISPILQAGISACFSFEINSKEYLLSTQISSDPEAKSPSGSNPKVEHKVIHSGSMGIDSKDKLAPTLPAIHISFIAVASPPSVDHALHVFLRYF